MDGLVESDRDRKDERGGRREGLLSRESGSLGAAFSATLPSSSNDLTLCQKGRNVCKSHGSKGIHLENY